jgi:hypothetical protein
MYRPTMRRLVALAALAVVTVALGGAAPTTATDVDPPSGEPLTPQEIRRLHAMFDDNPLLGGQVPPRRHLWVNRDVSIFVQFDSNDAALATRLRYIGISVKGVFCAEAQPDGPTGAFTHFHRLTAPVYGQGHGGAPGEIGYWLTWLAVDEFLLGTRRVTPGIDYQFAPTPAPTCGDDVPEPSFTGPGEGDLTRSEIADLAAAFDDALFTGGQKTPWRPLWVNERAGIFLEFDSERVRAARELRRFGLALTGTFCAQQQPHTDFSHYHKAKARNFRKGSRATPGETDGFWMLALAVDGFRERGRAVTPGVDRQYLPTRPEPC